MSPLPPTLPSRLMQVIAGVVLLMVGLGMQRWAVVCNRPCCDGHVKLARSCGAAEATASAPKPAPRTCACCAERDEAPAPATPSQRSAGCDDCEHWSLGVELAELSECAPELPAMALWPVAIEPWPVAIAATAGATQPPATGPPRPPRALRERTTIELLL
jgi:hypothetical protein